MLERPLILRSVFELGKAVKGLRSALVLFDDDLTSRIIRDETFVGRDSMLLANIHVDLALTGSYAEWQRRVQGAAGRYQAIWVGLYFTLRGADGKVVPEDEVLRWTAAHAKLPLFAFWDFAVGRTRPPAAWCCRATSRAGRRPRWPSRCCFSSSRSPACSR